ncbi:hypothetical protein WOLCODRAFT_113993 [Wolfiporia cocos MD-104 SS10]|uniref:Fanconi-associated nuclease n=1 Tax=Wolfiporia cocos (strain MD-104) TaxID=742152 RepID=A0A2H3JNV8_WOLCO|nr:hypothetical protein WOLCODRAFT_113993 [Wolfiporia cocos MD-104 SS10]
MRNQQARAVKAILEEVYPRWKDLVSTKEEEGARPISLQRFESGHILTRVVCKASSALGPLKEWAYELRVLEDLLGQRRWRRGRRGRWHERRVLLLTKREFIEQTPAACKRALAAVKEALEDADTHIIFRPKLERRLKTLEKKLNVPVEERHVCQGVLAEAVDTHIEGTRVWHRADAMVLDRTGRVVKPPSADIKPSIGVKTEAVSGLLQMSLPWAEQDEKMVEKTSRLASEKPRELPKWKGKSIWKGRDGEEVNVETLALQHFEDLGYRGYHCEGRIITTLFGFLMWDIIFAPIPGAFETPYQAAPLDLVDDTFLYSRQDLIEKRIAELEAGQAEQVLTHIYDENFERGTWCVGVRWDLFTREELLEIVKCLGGPALAVICRLLAEDYSGRVGGVPDLTIWNCEKGECKFVEVKGPGDVLRENQRAWIDVLLRAGVPVEMCRVEDAEGTKKAAKKGKTHADRERLKRKRVDYGLEDQRLPAESEDEEDEEVDYSQLDNSQPVQEATGDEDRPELITPKKRSTRGVVNRVEVVITSSPPKPIDSPVLKKRRL